MKKKKVERSYCSLSSSTHSLPLRGLPAPWVGLLLGSCSARFHSSGKLLLFLFYYFLRDLHAGAGQISWKSQALDLQLTFQVQAQCLVLLFKVNSTLQKTKVASVTSLWSPVAFVWFLLYHLRELLFLVLQTWKKQNACCLSLFFFVYFTVVLFFTLLLLLWEGWSRKIQTDFECGFVPRMQTVVWRCISPIFPAATACIR